jgi:hypothetical protein
MILAQHRDEVGAHQRHAVQRVARPPPAGDVAEQLAVARPHPLPRHGEPGRLDLRQAAEGLQGPQPVDRQAHERADRASRILVCLVHRDLGTSPCERDRARRPGHAAARYHDPHLSLRIT